MICGDQDEKSIVAFVFAQKSFTVVDDVFQPVAENRLFFTQSGIFQSFSGLDGFPYGFLV